MNENLVGYLMDVLEPDQRRDVEVYLAQNPEARRQLELLRQALDPLAADGDGTEPPPGLWVRTLGRVAEHRCRPLPAAPPPLTPRPPSAARGWWQRADVLVAASVLLCVMLLIPPGVVYLRSYQDRS